MPAPSAVKWEVLRRYGAGVEAWVETGTFRGDTTAVLAATGAQVVTIEPAADLAAAARHRFADNERVEVIEGTSEDHLDEVLGRLSGGSVALWLDAHYSGSGTFEGPQGTPMLDELAVVAKHLDRFDTVVVCIDDVRFCQSGRGADGWPERSILFDFPSRSDLVRWADAHGLAWYLEHDIFVARWG